MNQRTRNMLRLLVCMISVIIVFPRQVHADMGPKPSVHIQFNNMSDELCYGTLLCENESTGPASIFDGNKEHARIKENYPDSYYFEEKIWKAFVKYQDADGYYFLQEGWTVSETKEIAWTYYPPSRFKILLYYPEADSFVSSGIYERYAFDTYYTVDMKGINMKDVKYNEQLSTNQRIEAYRSYQYQQEICSFCIRITLTILIEILIALFFGFRSKKQLCIITIVNCITQILLNVILNIINYYSGLYAFRLFYALGEILVFAIEAVIYCTFLKRVSEKKDNSDYILYAFVANGISFVIGLYLASHLPGIF